MVCFCLVLRSFWILRSAFFAAAINLRCSRVVLVGVGLDFLVWAAAGFDSGVAVGVVGSWSDDDWVVGSRPGDGSEAGFWLKNGSETASGLGDGSEAG